MRTEIKKAVACAAMAMLLASLLGCKCLRPVQESTDGRLVILQEPQSQIALTNSTVSFSVVAMHVGPPSTNVITYQWRFNGIVIPGATNSVYFIASAQFTDVGAYDVVVTGSTLTSQTAFLSVYSLSAPRGSNGGTLQTPIGDFSSQSFTCGGGSFQKAFCPTSPTGGPALFYGPNASPQSGPFQNTSQASTVTIDTFSSDNGTADTGIMFQNNFVPINPPVCCNDDAPGGARQSRCASIFLSPNTGLTKNTYRLTLLYKEPPGPPASGVVAFNWLYSPAPE